MILIVSANEDIHATSVMRELTRQGSSATLLDMRDIPTRAMLSLAYDHDGDRRALTLPDTALDLDDINVVWWRRPQAYEPAPDISDPEAHNFVFHECEEAMQGLWLTLDAAWINPPDKDDRAARKAWQLDLARRCGLCIPRTLITNDPEQARAFIAREGTERTIYKAFQGNIGAWRETRLLKPAELDQIDAVRHAPVIFQEYVEADIDIRVTVIGDQIFPAAIHSQKSRYKVDFRMDMENVAMEAIDLPDDVTDGIARLMAAMGLTYGAIDLRRRPDGSHVFLEINPAGQWLFVEDATGQPITAALAAHMIARDREKKVGHGIHERPAPAPLKIAG